MINTSALQRTEFDEPLDLTPFGSNFSLQQQTHRHFVSNSPFKITTTPGYIMISQVGNIMTIEVIAARIQNGNEVAKKAWSLICEKMIGAGWSLMFEENYYEESNMICFFLGGDDLLNGKLPL